MKSPVPDRNALLFDIVLLLLANVLTAAFFVVGQGSLTQVLLTYFAQTVLIAVFYYQRLMHINATHIIRKWWYQSMHFKIRALVHKTSHDQFLYVLFFFVPLALLFFLFVNEAFSTNAFDYQHVSYQVVVITSLAFLIHHIVSYLVTMRAYRKGDQASIRIPYNKLAIRVVTIMAVMAIGLLAFDPSERNHLFVIFIGIKTIVDVTLSSSFTLLQRKSA